MEERFGQPVAREFELHGEEAFRAREEELVCELLERRRPGDVIALGGGSVLSERVREALGRHIVGAARQSTPRRAWERVQCAEAMARRSARSRATARPFRALHAARGAAVRGARRRRPAAGDPRCDARGASMPARARRGAGGTRLLWASSASGDYPVLSARGLLGRPAGGLASTAARARSASPTTPSRPSTASGSGGSQRTIAIPPGERHKTLASAERVWRELARAGMTRADHVVALGGGVVGDLAGFCAATYQRGVPVVQVPTTLVAQVDSAYGGKTGVDLPEAKNYVGAYHQPAAVLADPDTLATLPAAELAAGWVEVLKTALIAGGDAVGAGGGRRARSTSGRSSPARAPSSRSSPRTSATPAAARS